MSVFLHIHSFYNNYVDRTIENLSDIYADRILLMNAIKEIAGEVINENSIKSKNILLKPNWVRHSLKPEDELCLRTHDSFTLAVLELVLGKKPSRVLIGDAPIQGCRWGRMISEVFLQEVKRLSDEFNVLVEVSDFRRRKYYVAQNRPSINESPITDYAIFDIGKKSMLEPVTYPGKTKFRVTNYDPNRMNIAHAPGIHKYCITKEFLNADVVISLPKIKTHQKTGITGALKNIVGINGDKDFLPHHRIGGTRRGGDCYPGRSALRYWAELALDEANRKQGKKSYWYWQKLASALWRLSMPKPEHQMEAGWYGNDTTWRMVLDLNMIAEFGRADGSLASEKQRKIFSLCDGIIAGQGDGPLQPEPLPLGIISFSNDSALNDRAMALMMGFDPKKMPLLSNSHPISDSNSITLNRNKIHLDALKTHALKAAPPKGWMKFLDEIR